MIKMEGTERKVVNSDLWLACAGPRAILPSVGSFVVYFPQGHSEQVAASTSRAIDGHIPNYPNLQSQLVCQLHSLTLHADIETDEVFAQMTLQPVTDQEKDPRLAPDVAGDDGQRRPTEFFCKILTASDTSTHGGFSVPRRAAEKVFPPLDFTKQPPVQELQARDLHDNIWTFRHIYRGQPKRHLLTTGWSAFVSSKRLVAGDSVLFIRDDDGRLYLGIRRANNGRKQQTSLPSSVISCDSMHIGVLAAAAHAAATNSCFQVFYNPRFVGMPLARSIDDEPIGIRDPVVEIQEGGSFHAGVGGNAIPHGVRDGRVDCTKAHGDGDRDRGCGFCAMAWLQMAEPRGGVGRVRHRREAPSSFAVGDRPRLQPILHILSVCRRSTAGLPPAALTSSSRSACVRFLLINCPYFMLHRSSSWLALSAIATNSPIYFAHACAESLKAAASSLESTFWAAGGECDMDEYMKCCSSTWLRPDMSSSSSSSTTTTTTTSSNNRQAMHLPPSSSSPAPLPPTVASSHHHHAALLAHIQQPHEHLPYPIQPAPLQQSSPVHGNLQQSPIVRIQGHLQQSLQQTSSSLASQQIPPNFHAQPTAASTTLSSSSPMQRPAAGSPAGFPDYEFQARTMVIERSADAGPYSNVNEDGRVSNFVKLQASMAMQPPPYSQLPPLPQTPPLPDLQQPVLPQLQISSSWRSTTSAQSQLAATLSEQQLLLRQRPMPVPLLDTPSGDPWAPSDGQVQAKWFQFPRDSSQCESSSFPMLPNIQIAQSESLSTVTSGSYSRPLDDTVPDSSSLILPTTTRFNTINDRELPTQSTVNGNTIAVAGSFSSSPPAPAASSTSADPDGIHVNAAAGTAILNSSLNMPEWASGRIQSQSTPSPAPVRTFTKVHKLGSVGRSIDLSRLRSYEELRREVARMFNMEGQLEDAQSWRLVFVDNVGDILLVGDDPWEEFVSCVRAIKILSAAQVMQMNEGGGGWEEPQQQQQHLSSAFPLQQPQGNWRSNSSPDDHRTWNQGLQ